MANVSCFYKTPSQAQKLGLTVTKTTQISNSEAKTLADAYKQVSTHQKFFLGLAPNILGGAIQKAAVMFFGVTLPASVALSYGKTYIDQLSSAYEIVARSGSKCNQVRCTYQYRRKGSNDGAYWLTGVKIL